MELKGKFAAVMGMGKSGVAAAELLAGHGAKVRAVEEKPAAGLAEALEAKGIGLAPQDERALDGVDLVVLSPGVPADLPVVERARARGVPVIGEVELAGFFLQGPVIGITGSNGKTTTTALTGHILQRAGIDCQVGGNIGTPPTAMIATSKPDRWNVLELSSFQLETIKDFRAHVAVAMNVTDNHLDRHHTFANYAAAKAKLFETQRDGDFAVLNAADPVCVSFAGRSKAAVRWFNASGPEGPGALVRGGSVFLEGEEIIRAADVPLRGRHNLDNVMAAALAARIAGAAPGAIAEAVKTFPGVEHRLEFVRSRGGVDYFNDSKATSVDAALKAIDAFSGGLWIILGGKDKHSDYTVMRTPLERKARMALLIGQAAPIIEEQLAGAAPSLRSGTLAAAVEEASRRARPGDTVLLAPACSSYDQFQNFEERGRAFKALVAALPEEAG